MTHNPRSEAFSQFHTVNILFQKTVCDCDRTIIPLKDGLSEIYSSITFFGIVVTVPHINTLQH